MNIEQTIAAYLIAKHELFCKENYTNRDYSMQKHYAAIDKLSRATYAMINHPDWSIELQDKFYPRQPGEIPYPVSC